MAIGARQQFIVFSHCLFCPVIHYSDIILPRAYVDHMPGGDLPIKKKKKVCKHVLMRKCVWWPEVEIQCLKVVPSPCLRQRLSLKQEFIDQRAWLASTPRNPPVSTSPVLGLRTHASLLGSCRDLGPLSWGPHTFVTNILPTEHPSSTREAFP